MMPELIEAYDNAFSPGQTIDLDGRKASFSVAPAGLLSLPSGRIVLCDPLVSGPRQPFVQTVLPGRHLLDLSLLYLPGQGERIAMARVKFTRSEPTVWVVASRKADDVLSRKGSPFKSESGTGAFLDESALPLLGFESLENVDPVLEELTANYRPHRYWVDHMLDRRHNVVMLSTGQGPGSYISYFGIDNEGDTCVFLTDFSLLG